MVADRKKVLGAVWLAAVTVASYTSVASAKTVTLKYTTWGSTQEVKLNKDIIARFEAQNPGVKVKLIYIDGGNYFTGLLTQMAAGSGPDVMYINPQWSFPLYKMGVLKDLSAYFKADKDLLDPAIYYTQAYDGITYNGSRYGTTNGTNIQSIFYNTTLVANAGLPEPSADWTYADFVEYAQKMTLTTNGKPTQLGFDGVPVWYGSVFPILWAYGADMFDNPLAPTKCVLDSKAGVEALQFISDLYYKYRVSPSAVAPSPGSWDSGKVAMAMQGTWYIEQARLIKKIRWDIAPLPVGKDRIVPYFLGAYVVAKTTKNPTEAWKFAKFFQSREAQQLIARDGLITPMMRSVAQSDAFQKAVGAPAHHRVRTDGLSRARLADPLHVRFPKMVADIVYPAWSRMLANKQSPADTAARIVTEVNKMLKASTK